MLHKVDYCMLKITNRCNHKCPICYAESSSFDSIHDIELSRLKVIVDKLHEANVTNLLILGGDPVLYSALKWICGYANALGGTLIIGKDDKGKTVNVKINLHNDEKKHIHVFASQ